MREFNNESIGIYKSQKACNFDSNFVSEVVIHKGNDF